MSEIVSTDKPYTPGTFLVRMAYMLSDHMDNQPVEELGAEFDRWLADHDVEVAAAAEQRGAVKALREAAKDWRWSAGADAPPNPGGRAGARTVVGTLLRPLQCATTHRRPPMTNYGIQYQPISQTIATGRLNKDRTLFLDKQDVTDGALMAAIEYVHNVYDGSMLTGATDGTNWHVQVTKTDEEGNPL